MSLSSLQLDAFLGVAKAMSFSQAAGSLHLTQSALSQRVAKLEAELGLTLFRRLPRVSLTEAGEKLLRFCQMREAMENEFLSGEMAGVVRIAAYSSVLRSVVIPALAPFLRAHPKIQAEFKSREMSELPALLRRGDADFVVMDYRLKKDRVEARKLGEETYVVIEAKTGAVAEGRYLDHDPSDTATAEFFSGQPPLSYQRSFFGDVYGVLDGAILGLGRAVMSRHLVRPGMPLRIVKGFAPRRVDVVLHFNEQPFYTAMHEAIVEELGKHCPPRLSPHPKKSRPRRRPGE